MANLPIPTGRALELVGSCPLCASDTLKELKGYSSAFLTQCARCGFVFSGRKATDQELQEHYSKYNRASAISGITIKRYRELLDMLESFRKTGNLLDVGCGDGHFLAVAKERGWKVHGTEYTRAAVSICEAKGIIMYQGSLPSAPFGPTEFDVITSFEVIEHIQHPQEEARAMFLLLRPGGACYLTTPNFNSVSRRLMGPRWNVIEYPEHLGYFTRSSLKRLFVDCGFRYLKSSSTGFSLDRARAGWSSRTAKTGMDESIRQSMERNSAISGLKRLANYLLNITSAGDSLKAFFLKPQGLGYGAP
jgi:2-polyprenyl-3-methyl-5-hydroxy-6-metoxy-1,4-benzoquinol methylase